MKKNLHCSKAFIWIFGVLLALTLTACGSGGGPGGPAAGNELTADPVGGTSAGGAVVTTGSPTSPPANSVVPGTLLPGASGAGGSGAGAPGGGASGGTGTSPSPMMLSSNPSHGAINVPLSVVAANNTVTTTPVSATFSEAMNPASLVTPAMTFTLKTSASGQNVAGQVSLNASNTIATLLPTSALSPNTEYTATVMSAATSTSGTPLVGTYVWVFTTGSSGSTGQAPIDMGAAAAYLALGGASIENLSTAGQPTRINGQLGVFQNSTTVVQGFTESSPAGTGIILTGGIQISSGLVNVQRDFNAALSVAISRTMKQTRIGVLDLALTQVDGALPGVFPPGLYSSFLSAPDSTGSSGSAALMLKQGDITLDAQGNPDAVWVFKAGSTLDVGDARKISLVNGARASQVFWVVGSSVTVGDQVDFKGNILAVSSISLGTVALSGTKLEGRAMSGTSLNLNNASLKMPAP